MSTRIDSRLALILGALAILVVAGIIAGRGARTPTPSQPPVKPVDWTVDVQRYMKENFGMPGMETSWYPHITALAVEDRRLRVDTDLSARDAQAKDEGMGLCFAASGYAFGNRARGGGIAHIQVRDKDGIVIASRYGPAEKCELR